MDALWEVNMRTACKMKKGNSHRYSVLEKGLYEEVVEQ